MKYLRKFGYVEKKQSPPSIWEKNQTPGTIREKNQTPWTIREKKQLKPTWTGYIYQNKLCKNFLTFIIPPIRLILISALISIFRNRSFKLFSIEVSDLTLVILASFMGIGSFQRKRSCNIWSVFATSSWVVEFKAFTNCCWFNLWE